MKLLKTLLFALLVILLPSQFGYHFWPSFSLINGVRVDYLSPTIYVTDVLTVALLFISLPVIRIHKRLLFCLAIFAFINIFFSSIPLVSLYRWLKIFEISLLSIVVWHNKMKFEQILVRILPLAAIWTSLLAITEWFHGGSVNGVFYYLGERNFTTSTPGIALSKIGNTVSLRPYATLPHPNALSGFLLVSLLLLFGFKQKSRLLWIAVVLSTFVLFISESYAIVVSLLFLFFFFVLVKYTRHSKSRLWKLFVFEAVLISIAFPYLISQRTDNVDTLTSAVRERIELSILSGYISTNRPIVGVGLGNFVPSIPHYTDNLPDAYRSRTTSWLQPVHNIPLLVESELGILGLLILFICVIIITPTAPLVIVFITSIFDHYWLTLQTPLLLLAIVVGTSYGLSELMKR